MFRWTVYGMRGEGMGGGLKRIKVTRCNRMALRVCGCVCVGAGEDRSSFFG